MHEPTLTIGLPVYNGEAFLAESIDSVLTQDFTDLELVITDNASTDGTAAICREYAARDPRVRYRRNATNLGIGGNFNAAFGEARGRYFKWHAADDLIGPGHLSLCVAELERDPGVTLVTTRTKMVEADGTTPLPYDAARGVYPTSYAVRLLPPLAAFGADDPSARFRALLTDLRGEALNNYIYGMMRTELVRRGPLFEPYVGADKVLLSRMILAGRFVEMPDELFIWRHHAGEFGFQRHRDAARIWNPRSTGRLSTMAARQLGGYANAIRSARLTPAQKASCFFALGLKVPHGLVRKTQRRWQGRQSTPGVASGDHRGVG